MSKTRMSSIDVLKGICIIFVITTHFSWTDSERLRYLFPFWIGMAIPIFMIISGYVNSLSYERHNISDISKAYDIQSIIDKLIRFSLPFTIIFLLDGIISRNFHLKKSDGPFAFLCAYARGGHGAGSYYFPFIIQFIFVFPVIYFIIKKYDIKGYFLCGLINLIYEFLIRAYGVNLRTYRVLVFRYIWVIAFGVLLAIGKNKLTKKMYMVLTSIGIIYIILFMYYEKELLITKWWVQTSMWASLFILPFVAFFINHNFKNRIMELIGKASYHIFLIQMIYYNHSKYIYIPKRYLQLIVNILICLSVGVVFYVIESYISKIIRGKVKGIIEKNK